MKAPSHTVAGIDVGGTKKGFHAVALREERIVATLATSLPGQAVAGAASSTCRLSALMHPVDGVIPAGRDCANGNWPASACRVSPLPVS